MEFDRRAMLANLGENIVLPTYRAFDAEVAGLSSSVGAYCAALGTPDEAPRLEDARAAWRATMSQWQVAEMMLFGPAAMDANTLRDRIYSWPVVSSCAVDQEVMLRYADPASYDISSKLTNRRGLDALEYLLFAPSLATTCPPQIEPAGWNELADADKLAARCGLAEDVVADLAQQSAAVLAAWEPAQGNYLSELVEAGNAGSSISSAQEAINIVSDALFYIDSEVKDMKLGQPAGIVVNICNVAQEPCFNELESPFARYSKDEVLSNLRGFEMVFLGHGPGQDPAAPEALGFDDFLLAAGADALASTMVADITQAIGATEAVPATFYDALTTDYASMVVAHTEVKDITDNMKSQFLTVLGLDLPDSAAGDND